MCNSATTWCHFRGYVTAFKAFIEQCFETEMSPTIQHVLKAGPADERVAFSFQIWLDSSEAVVSCPWSDFGRGVDANYIGYGLIGWTCYYNREKITRQRELVQWLSSSFHAELQVLELESSRDEMATGLEGFHSFGILLLRKHDESGREYFRRLGCCYWEDYSLEDRRERYPNDWKKCDGIFG